MFKVTHFNSFLLGGAAIAARRLHDSLCQHGVESSYCFLVGDPPNGTYIRNPSRRDTSFINRLEKLYGMYRSYRYLNGRSDWLESFTFPKTRFKSIIEQLDYFPDIIHLHWIAEYIDYPSFFETIPDETPIVWTLHDMNPFTGGCHYAWTCVNFKQACGNCFQVGRPAEFDVSHCNLALKKRLYKKKNLHIVADSYWLENEAKQSSAFSLARSFQTIHYGLDTVKFTSKNKELCKDVLGINRNARIILFGADDISNKRKGLAELLSALKKIHASDVHLLTFGKGQIDALLPDKDIKCFGHIASSDLLSIVYSAADIFVIPSLYEAFGQTALEAMACGTPVIGFNTGGIPDIVVDGKTGLLAEQGNEDDLAAKIQFLLDNPELRLDMGRQARLQAESKFTLDIQARQYIDLYEKLLGNK